MSSPNDPDAAARARPRFSTDAVALAIASLVALAVLTGLVRSISW